MSNIKLLPGEEIIWEARVSWIAKLYAIIMFAALLVVRNLSGLMTTELVITNQRVIGKRGMVRGKKLDVPHAQIETVRVSRGLFGKLFDYGTITITTKGGSRFMCKGMAEPLYVQMQIEEAVEIAVLGYKLSDYVGDTNV